VGDAEHHGRRSPRSNVVSVRLTDQECAQIDEIGRSRSTVIRGCVVAVLAELARQQSGPLPEFDTTEADFDAMLAAADSARLVTDFYEGDEPIEKIRAIIDDVARDRFVTAPPDLRIVVHRENGRWWAEIDGRSDYAAWDVTFDGLCGRLAEGLHLFGLNRERTSIIILDDVASATAIYPSYEPATTAIPKVFVFRERAS
jgi:hypothetical protein